MDLLLIRHADPIRIVDAAGPADRPLPDRGRLPPDRLPNWLAGGPAAYTAHVAGISRVMWFETQYASISRVVASSRPGGPRSIVTLNETPHLRGTGLLPS